MACVNLGSLQFPHGDAGDNMGNSSSTHKISAQDKYASISSRYSLLTLHRAILDMKNQRDKLHQYQKRITVLTDREKEIAKECLAKGDTKKAKLALRRKKYQESLLAKTDAQLHQLEQLTSDVEFALVQKDVMYGIQQGTAVLTEIHKEMGGIEQVEKLMGDNAEARAYQEVRQSATTMRAELTVACNRKSASFSQTRCRTRTKTKWKTSSRPSRPRSTASSYPMHPCSSLSIQRSKRRLRQRTEQRGEQRSVLRNRRLSPCWHSAGNVDFSIRAWRFAFDHLVDM
jgi:hypothetical protein